MKRLFKAVLLAILVLLLTGNTVMAAWDYLFPTTLVDTSNTTRAYYPVFLGYGGQTLIDSTKISADGLDTNMQIGSADIKYMMATGNVTVVLPSLPIRGVVTASLYTGYTPLQTGFPIIPGDGGYVTVLDDASIEPSDNFTIEIKGWINTDNGTDKNLAFKEDALRVYVSENVSESLTTRIAVYASDTLQYSSDGEANNTEAAYTLMKTITLTADVEEARVKFDIKNSEDPGTSTSYGKIYKNGVAIGTQQTNITATYATKSQDISLSAASGDSIQLYGYNSEPGGQLVYVRNFRIYYDGGVEVTATGVSSGESTVKVTLSPVDTSFSTDLQVITDSDDARRGLGADTWGLTIVYQDAGMYSAGDNEIGGGMRFTSIAIPQGATIDVAYLTLRCAVSYAGTDVNTRISAEDVDDAPTFADNKATFDARWANRTTARVEWDSIPLWSAGNDYNSPEIKTVIQEIIDRGSWTSGNDMVIFWEDFEDRSSGGASKRHAYSYNGSVTYAPKLHIEYTTPANYLKIFVDNVEKDSSASGSASVLDTSAIWTFIQNNVMPYTDNITISVGGTQRLYLAPTVMISGTNIPDRSGNSNNGTITWGSNSGISLSYGAMTSFESWFPTANVTGGFDMPSSPMPETWFASGGGASALPFYDSFSAVAAQTGKPVQSYYFNAIIGVAFGAFLGVVMITRSALLAYIAMIVVFAVGSSMTIVPGWIVFVLIVVGVGIMYLYKQVAY